MTNHLVIVMDMVNVNVVSGLTPQPPLQGRGGAVLSLIMSTTIIKFVYIRILIMIIRLFFSPPLNRHSSLLATSTNAGETYASPAKRSASIDSPL